MDNVEMRHNSIVFQRLKRENMRLLQREQYNKQWIQNWDMVQKLVDIWIEPVGCDMLLNYYDIPKQIWDDQFPLNRQMNHYAPDYQEHLEEFTIEVPCPQPGDDLSASYTSHKITGGREHTININTIDRVARYGSRQMCDDEETSGKHMGDS